MLIFSDMILFDIGKNTIVKQDTVGSMHLKALGGSLHNYGITALFLHFPEGLLQGIGFRCGISAFFMDAGIIDSGGSDETAIVARFRKNCPHHTGCCGFSLGTGDADHQHLLGGVGKIKG